ncbi:5-formyltetrahydrofolate cyclo-ligase [bacterium]|nr:5-formyltetrahydrofolate cyclo-ligase [bacterium]
MTPEGGKRALRKRASGRRSALGAEWRARASAAAAQNASRFIHESGAKTVALFASFGDEIDTHGLIRELLKKGIGVALPLVVRGEKRIEMRRIDRFPEDCRGGAYGILEPDPALCPEIVPASRFDVIFVPGLLFTREGWRLGYGGGYYDRLLKEDHTALAVAFGFSKQIVDDLPHDAWDRPVNRIVTEAGIIVCGA